MEEGTVMAIVRIKDKYQVTIPNELRDHLNVGDLLEARRARDGVITLTPKSLTDQRIAEGLADVRAGRVHGPYSTVEEAMAAMDLQIGAEAGVRSGRIRRTR